jgi:hypothetical protein
MGPDDLTPEENAKFEALAAEGDQEKLMKYIIELGCKYDGKAPNFGDGAHHTCPAVGVHGGKKRRTHKKHAKHGGKKHRKSRKSRKHKKSHKKSHKKRRH